MDPRKKLDVLEGSFNSGVIGKEEYEKEKEKLEPDVKEFDRQVEEINKAEIPEEPKKSSDKVLIISIAVIALLLISVFAFSYFYKPKPLTLEEMHVLNLQGKLKPSQGYVYKKVYSFVTLDNVWYTQLKSPKGTKIYDMALRYSPRDLTSIRVQGALNTDFFNNQTELYVTFNPKGGDFAYVSLAVADFETHMSKVFEKAPVGACDRNETETCKTRPIVTCNDADKLVLYINQSDKFKTYYNNNCIVVQGNGFDLVKGVDRVLYNLYNIMEQKESN